MRTGWAQAPTKLEVPWQLRGRGPYLRRVFWDPSRVRERGAAEAPCVLHTYVPRTRDHG